ncbi:MAG TPA: hypothetical protein VGH51_22745 [Candidatus Angelobacter sp.]|jgi:hypothetical protein
MMEIGSSGKQDIGKPNLTTEARRHGENQEIQIMISTSDLTSSSSPLCCFVSSVVKGFSVLTIFVSTILGNFGIAGNSWGIGVSR